MKKILIPFILITIIISWQLIADNTHNYYLNGKYLSVCWEDTKAVFDAPLHWDKKEILMTGVLSGIGIALYLYDKQMLDFVQDHKSDVLTTFTDITNYLGDGWVIIPSQLLLYGYGYFTDDLKARKIALETMESFVIVGATVTALKMLTGRHRPNSHDDPYNFEGPTLSSDNRSFPSGHTAVVFSWATVLADNFRDQPAVGIIAYTLAAGTGFSRMYKNKHWLSDVFVAALLGHFITKKIVSRHEHDEPSTTVFSPLPLGFSISFSF